MSNFSDIWWTTFLFCTCLYNYIHTLRWRPNYFAKIKYLKKKKIADTLFFVHFFAHYAAFIYCKFLSYSHVNQMITKFLSWSHKFSETHHRRHFCDETGIFFSICEYLLLFWDSTLLWIRLQTPTQYVIW